MQPAFTFRHALLSDLPAIVNIYNATVAGRMVTADTEPVSVENRVAWFEQHSADRRPLWVVESEKEIAGWLSFQSFYGRPAYNGTCEVSVYVHEAYRRQGLGSLMLEYAFEQCTQLHVHTLMGFIFAHNLPSLNLFYNKGFEKWGHFPRIAVLDGIERDLIITGKRVTQ